MKQRNVRNIKIFDYENASTLKRIEGLKKSDNGVTFWFEPQRVDDEFLCFAKYCIDLLKEKGIENYKFSVVTYNEKSKNKDVNLTTRILKTDELERLILLEGELPSSAELVVSEDNGDTLYNYSLGSAIQAHEFVNEQVEYIKSLGLSTWESYLMAYEVASGLFYNEEPEDDHEYQKSRTLISGLTQDTFVCVAHAKVFNGILNGLGIPSLTEALFVSTNKKGYRDYELHVNVMVYLNDPKYMLDGVVMSDACNDATLFKTVKNKKGEQVAVLGKNTMLLSAINIDDVCKMKGSFYFDDFNLLKMLYHDKELLSSKRYGDIFDCFDDEYAGRYLDFFLNMYPQFNDRIKKFDEVNEKLVVKTHKEYAPIVYDMMLDVFGDIEVASEIEKKDKSDIDVSLVLYDKTLTKLFGQAVVLLMCGVDEAEVRQHITDTKIMVDFNLERFDKKFEVEKVINHNNLIAERYGEKVEGARPITLSEYLDDYYEFCEDEYAVHAYQMFSRRADIDALFKMVRACSPIVEAEDYLNAYLHILDAQGYPSEKMHGYALRKFHESAMFASCWFDSSAYNAFSRYSEEKWAELNARNSTRQDDGQAEPAKDE